MRLPINLLKPSRYQTRQEAFERRDDLENLASSIAAVGLLEPPRVRREPLNPKFFEIISGHRRIRAVSKFLHWKEIECEVFEALDDFDAFRLNITENVQRADLSAYEEGMAYLLCQKLFGLSDDEIGNQLHKSRQSIASKRELAVSANIFVKYAEPSSANAFLRNFSVGHKEILVRVTDPQRIRHVVMMVARGGTVRNIKRFILLFGDENAPGNSSPSSPKLAYPNRVRQSTGEVSKFLKTLQAAEARGRMGEALGRGELVLECGREQPNSALDHDEIECHEFCCPFCNGHFDIRIYPGPKDGSIFVSICPKAGEVRGRDSVHSFLIQVHKTE